MYTMVLLAALTNQIVFDVKQNGAIWTVVPQVTLIEDCECHIQMEAIRKGMSGNSTSKQRSQAQIKGNQPYSISRLQINVEPGDDLIINVTVSDGKNIHLTKQWSPPGIL